MAEEVIEKPKPSFSQVWQLPVVAMSLILFGIGLYLTLPKDLTPQYVEILDTAAAQIQAHQFENALETVGTLAKIEPELPKNLRARYHQHTADALYLGQRAKGWDNRENHETIILHYESVLEHGTPLGPIQKERLANTLVAIGRSGAALELLNSLGDGASAARQRLLKRMVNIALAAGPGNEPAAHDVIDRLMREENLLRANEIWAIAKRAQLMLRRDDIEDTLDMLLRRYARLASGGKTNDLGELMVLLGKAHLVEGDRREADVWFTRAQQTLDQSDPMQGDILVGKGRIQFANGNIADDALELFTKAVNHYSATPSFRDALIGRAETYARLGNVKKAIEDYMIAAKQVVDGEWTDPRYVQHLTTSIASQHDLRLDKGDYDLALKYLDLRKKIHGQTLPDDVVLKMARAHEARARKKLGLVDKDADPSKRWNTLKTRAERIEVMHDFELAAELYFRHATAMQEKDNDAHGTSLWKAGELYDVTGLHEEAIKVFDLFAKGRPSDPLHLEAKFRLAQAYRASGKVDEAIDLYDELIKNNPKSKQATASLVPLARAYMSKDGKYQQLAEEKLLEVVTDHPVLRPESNEYRSALIELGQLYYHRGKEGDFEKAIKRLEEAAARYGDEFGLPAMQFQLGDAYRKSVNQIDKKLAAKLPPSKRAALQSERGRRLDRARQSFDAVIIEYEKRGVGELEDIEKLYLRNSYFYRADCAFDLKQYEGPEGAIQLYEKARQRYSKEPASLIAMIQIVNSYSALKQFDKARAANERAKVFLKRIPESAFKDPNLPMTRKHWQRWLETTSDPALTSAGNS